MSAKVNNSSRKRATQPKGDAQSNLAEGSSADNSSSSEYSENEETLEPRRVKSIARKGAKLSKQELKRIRNREAAKKSRRLKKEHIVELEEENQLLRLENERLQQELANIRDGTSCSKCTTIKTEEQLAEQPFDDVPSAQQIVSEHQQDKQSNKKTDDDMRYERITDETDKHSYLQRFFMILAGLLVLVLLTTDIGGTISQASMFKMAANESTTQHRCSRRRQRSPDLDEQSMENTEHTP